MTFCMFFFLDLIELVLSQNMLEILDAERLAKINLFEKILLCTYIFFNNQQIKHREVCHHAIVSLPCK